MFGLFKKKKAPELDASKIVPRIKHTNFLTAITKEGVPSEEVPYTEPLVADLLVAYAMDLPGLYAMMSRRTCEALLLRPEQLRELALENMRRQFPQIRTGELTSNEGVRILRVAMGGGLEACSLLAPRFWNHVAATLAAQPIVAVPERETVLICAESSKESLAAMCEISARAFEEGGNHALTRVLLTWQNGVWSQYYRG
jgi:uncharacterized protein YtpQ (UPF0354 family)